MLKKFKKVTFFEQKRIDSCNFVPSIQFKIEERVK